MLKIGWLSFWRNGAFFSSFFTTFHDSNNLKAEFSIKKPSRNLGWYHIYISIHFSHILPLSHSCNWHCAGDAIQMWLLWQIWLGGREASRPLLESSGESQVYYFTMLSTQCPPTYITKHDWGRCDIASIQVTWYHWTLCFGWGHPS